MSQKDDAIQIVNDILDSKAIVFHDQYNTAYIAPKGDGSDVMKIGSSEFKSYLSGELWGKYTDVISTTLINTVVQTLQGIARHKGEKKLLDARAHYDGSTLLYDLGKLCIEVSRQGWKLVPNPPIVFRRFSHQKKQSVPVNGELNDLKQFINIKNEDDILLFLVFTVAAFLPGFPHPILVLHGPQGAGKSTPMRVLKELIDPSSIQGVSAPKDEAGFAHLASRHYLLMLDNLSGMPTWLSDSLARASTGDGFSKRALYTDDDDVVMKIQRTIMMNGINQVITKADLLDRSILIKVERIEPSKRMSEDQFWKKFEEKRAGILGGIFDTIVLAMKLLPDVDLKELPRMADFTKWGYAIAEAAGYEGEDFLRAYSNNIDQQNQEAIEASPVAQAIIEFMKDKENWSGTAASLLQRINQIAFFNDLKSSVLWPKDPQWLSKRLNEVEPNLQTRHIYFTRGNEDNQRIIYLKRESKD
jgi:energy-coupling factor transporter ATP-binding protein EcfA2